MKHRFTSRTALAALLVVGAFTSTSALAANGPDRDHHNARPAQQHAAPQPQRPVQVAPPPRHSAPPPRHVSSHRAPPHARQHRERSWGVGRVLPRTVIYHDVPTRYVDRLPPPPRGHRYVRVDGDALLIVIGTGLVVNVVQDIFY
ncbi:MAG: RcnB family protein [Azoarcus sp.]|jgi:Ni/Co efflux regulator RcnB|nr:RcnB family protein [Azoarcus sp.]